MKPLAAPSLEQVRAAAGRLAGLALRTPLLPLELAEAPAPLWLKLENLQPIGSFKLRGAGNAIAAAGAAELAGGVVTASAGNMAQGVAWCARRLGVPASVVVPEGAPQVKLEAIARLGARLVRVPYDRWWQTLLEHRCDGLAGRFIHPFADPEVLAGNGTIGLEIVEELPEVETILVPFGGGGLSCGIAAAAKALRPGVRVLAVEVETAAPLAASLAAGRPVAIEHRASFVDGIGGKSLSPEMWPLVRELLDGTVVVSLAAVAEAIRLLALRQRVVAEGAGAAAVAAALEGGAARGTTVCVISGGNLDAAKLAAILQGGVP